MAQLAGICALAFYSCVVSVFIVNELEQNNFNGYLKMLISAKKSRNTFRHCALGFCASIVIIGMTACGGGGGGSSSTPVTTSVSASKVFVADSLNSAIASVSNPNPSPGTMTVDRIIAGASTNISGAAVRDLAYDAARNYLYVANGTSILVFSNANITTGNISPARTITSGQITFINAMFLDTVNDVLYVAVTGNGAPNDKVLVFNHASTANGSLVPDRSITITWNAGTFSMTGISVDTTHNILYVAGSGSTPSFSNRFLVYDNASTLNGTGLTANRTVSFGLNTYLWGAVTDGSNDRLYVASYTDHTVMVFDNASAANGAAAPTRTINLGSNNAPHIALDTVNNRLYASAATGVYIINGASTANGAVAATFAIAPGGTSLSAIAVTP